MTNKRAAFVLVLFFFVLPLWAQPVGSASANASESRYDMLLSWNGDEYTLRYEVIVEKEEREAYRIAAQRFTTNSVLRLSLTQGNYRFRVVPYDLLNKPGKSSDWITFEVHPAPVAELPKTEEQIEEIPTVETAEEIGEVEETTLVFLRKAFDAFFTVSWMPVVPVHALDGNVFFDQNPSFTGMGICFGFVYNQSSFINFGVDFSASWYAFNSIFTFEDILTQHIVTFEFDILAQKWFPKKMFALTFRLGAGLSLILNPVETGAKDTESAEDTENTTGTADYSDSWYGYHANIGLSLLCRPKDTFYMEIGLDYIYLFTGAYPGYFRPFIGIGWRS